MSTKAKNGTGRQVRRDNECSGRTVGRPRPYQSSVLAGTALTAALTVVMWSAAPGSLLLAYLVAINISAFCIMGFDKQAAVKGVGRTPELVLGLWALLGGSLGVFAGMRAFRHKTKKARFQFIFGAVLIMQALGITQLRNIAPSVAESLGISVISRYSDE